MEDLITFTPDPHYRGMVAFSRTIRSCRSRELAATPVENGFGMVIQRSCP